MKRYCKHCGCEVRLVNNTNQWIHIGGVTWCSQVYAPDTLMFAEALDEGLVRMKDEEDG